MTVRFGPVRFDYFPILLQEMLLSGYQYTLTLGIRTSVQYPFPHSHAPCSDMFLTFKSLLAENALSSLLACSYISSHLPMRL